MTYLEVYILIVLVDVIRNTIFIRFVASAKLTQIISLSYNLVASSGMQPNDLFSWYFFIFHN